MRRIVLFLFVYATGWSQSLKAIDFYVSPSGNDDWSGRIDTSNSVQTDGPFKSLEKAKSAIRKLKEGHGFNEPVTVHIDDGIYELQHPLGFNLIDSGFADRKVIWQGKEGGRVIVSGGIKVNCGRVDNGEVWRCPLNDFPLSLKPKTDWRIHAKSPSFQLYVDGRKMELARWPNQGWAHIKAAPDSKSQFSAIESLPNISESIKNAQVHIFPGSDWFDQIIGLSEINLASNMLTLSNPTSYTMAPGRRFFIENSPQLLDNPGEWIYFADQNALSFIAPSDKVPTDIIVSSLPNLVSLDGANHIQFKNIVFSFSSGTAIALKNSNSITFDHIEISNAGEKGIEGRNVANFELLNSHVHHTGEEGVDIKGGETKELKPSQNIVSNSHIHDMGQWIYTKTPAIRLDGVGNRVANNLLERGSEIAILISGNDNVIEKNEVRNFCQQSADCGGIYSGQNWSYRGNSIRYNFIHDIYGYGLKSFDPVNNQAVYESPDFANGIYLDDGVSGFDVNSNIITNVGRMGIQLGGGRDNRIYNNYIEAREFAVLADDRWPNYNWSRNIKFLEESPYKTGIWKARYPELSKPINNISWPEGNRIERNIMITTQTNTHIARYFLPKESSIIENNLVWSPKGPPNIDYKLLEQGVRIKDAPWEQWLAQGVEKNSIVADPCVSIVNKAMVTCPDSPINQIGFRPIPTDIGLLHPEAVGPQ